MVTAELVMGALQRNWDMVDAALADLEDANWTRRPTDQSNSVAWILWHMNRVMDTFIYTRLQGKLPLWTTDGWHQKFGMGDDPEDRGAGWSIDRVVAWEAPSREVMLGYYEVVKSVAGAHLSSLTPTNLEERRVIPPVAEPRSVADAVGQVIWDNVAHGGQIAYLRGFYQGMGWHR